MMSCPFSKWDKVFTYLCEPELQKIAGVCLFRYVDILMAALLEDLNFVIFINMFSQ